MSLSSCTQIKADCGKNEIAVSDQCHAISLNDTRGEPFRSTRKPGIMKNVLGTQDGLTIVECAVYCKSNDSCKAFSLEYPSSSFNIHTTGLCTIGEFSPTVPSNSSGVLVNKGDCAQVYTRGGLLDRDKSGISLVSEGGNSIYISSNGKPANQLPVIKSNIGGVECRRIISNITNNDSNSDSSQYMAEWCKNNQNIDTCQKFCSSSETSTICPWVSNNQTKLLILLGIFLFLLGLMIFTYIRASTDSKKVFILVIFLLLLTCLGIYMMLLYLKRNDTIPDYQPSITIPESNCQNKCSNGYNCNDFLGGCDCPIIN
jgi:hypothetical protein